jgi:UrcA family protein
LSIRTLDKEHRPHTAAPQTLDGEINVSKITNTIASIASLLMAALPALALTSAAHAAPAHHAVQISDLNLASPAGQRVLSARTEMVANQVCKASGTAFQSLSDAQSCKAGVRAEVAEKAAAVRQTQVAAR